MQQSAPMELGTKTTTSQVPNEIMAEICEAEAAIRNQNTFDEILQHDKNKKGKV